MKTQINLFDFIKHISCDDIYCPEISYDDYDGSINFDWIDTKKRMVTMSVTRDGEMSYAWLIDDDHGHRTEQYDGKQVSQEFMDILKKL